MRILPKLLWLIIFSLSGFYGLFLAVNAGKLNRPIKSVLEYFFNAQVAELSFQDGVIKAKKVVIPSSAGKLLISDLNLNVNYSDGSLELIIAPGEICITTDKDELIAGAEYSGKIIKGILKNTGSTELNFSKIAIPNLFDIYNKPYENGLLTYSSNISGQEQSTNFGLNFSESTYLRASSVENSGKLKLTAENIPLKAYIIFEKIAPDNKLVAFFQEFIRNGYIIKADFLLDPNQEPLTKNSLTGKAKVQKLDFSYNPELPQLKKMDLDIDVLDSNITFKINSAYSSDVLLSDGLILMNWQGVDNTELKITAKGRGPAVSLTDFISKEEHLAMNKANIDLRKITGNTDIDVSINIPLKPGTKNSYNISANIPKASLSIFKNYVNLTNASLQGLFNGDQVLLSGFGKINNFKSDLNFIFNLTDKTEFSHKLDIKTYLKISNNSADNKTNKLGFLSLLGGSSVIDLTYINKDSQGIITANSDITGLDLYFDKLGIRKKQNDKSEFTVKGIFTDPTEGTIDFSVASRSGVKTNGSVQIGSNKATFNIKEIKHKETNLSAKIILNKNLFDADIRGKALDLSDANMLRFLEKEREEGATRLTLAIERIKLKDNIWLDNAKAEFECDNLRCFSGYFDSKIGSKSLEMVLTAKGSQEEWLVQCTNAGALLRGLDMYNSMRAGNLTLNLTTSRKEIKPGHIIPIHSGKFSFERFMLHDAPTMTRMVSFISLPGFVSMISGNKDIAFANMSGNFSFQNNILSINNSSANGPYFGFTLKGNIDTQKRFMDIYGHVTPQLYGISSVIGSIPIIGRIFTGNEQHQGLVSKSYRLKEKY